MGNISCVTTGPGKEGRHHGGEILRDTPEMVGPERFGSGGAETGRAPPIASERKPVRIALGGMARS
jgi:hypothetical protein